MYYVYCDEYTLLDTRGEDLILISPKLTLQDNSAGSFDFTISPKHPYYNVITRLTSVIKVVQDDEEIFIGRVMEEKVDFYKRKTLHCEGELAFLSDSMQPPARYQGISVRAFLEALIAVHNSKVDEDKAFTVGSVTVVDSNNYVYKYTNWESTMKVIKTDLIDTYGGHLRIRYEDGIRYLDYLADYPRTSDQVIQFGENLLDFSKNFDMSDICTVVIPLGARLQESEIENLEAYLTIESVNDGLNYLINATAAATYGKIERVVKWSDVNTASILKSKGEAYLREVQYENMVLEISAVDLHNLDVDEDNIRLLDEVRAVSETHGLDRLFPVTKLSIPLLQPSQAKFTLGTSQKISMTTANATASAQVMKRIEEIPTAQSVLTEAVANATALIHSALNGHVVITEGADELLIMDTDDIETATKVWRWNLNGLGYSSTGYNGTYGTAITMDGSIVGSFITAGSITADHLDVTYKESVETKISDSLTAAEGYTDDKLTDYWTQTETATQISNTATSITMLAYQQAAAYTNNQLSNYSTSAQIQVTTDAITAEVNKKLNSSELSTKIEQSASAVKIAWNNISKYIQFESGELRIYDSNNTTSQKLVSAYGSYGARYYYKGVRTGLIGTTQWSTYEDKRGLMFGLENASTFMGWGAKETSDGNYDMKLGYFHDSSIHPKGVHFLCDTYANNNLYITDTQKFTTFTGGSVGFNGPLKFVNSSNQSSVLIDGESKAFKIFNNVNIDFYADLNMHNYSILNQSDARLKTNIKHTKINGLKVINGIDLKEYDWIQNGKHEPIGIIAQQLQEVAPELVEEKDGKLSIKATKLVYYLAKAVQELSTRVGIKYYKSEWEDTMREAEKIDFCNSLPVDPVDNEEIIREKFRVKMDD